MKILLVTASYRPSINGVAISVSNLKQSLEALGHKILVLAPQNKEVKGREAGIVRYPSIDNPLIKDYPIPITPLTLKSFKRVTKFKPDIVHVHHPFHIGFMSYLFAQTMKIPLVFTYHTKYGYYTKKYFKFLPGKLQSELISNNVLDFCKKVDLIIAPSNEVKTYLKSKLKDKKIVAIPSIVDDLVNVNKTKLQLRKNLGIPEGKKVLLSVTRIAPEKNIKTLIKTLPLLPDDFLLMLCGIGPMEDEIKDLITKLKVGNKVALVGRVTRQDLPMYYQASDYFINTSRSETQGLVYWEAARFGLPVISVDSHVAREWVFSDFGVIVTNKPDDLAKEVIKLSKRNYKTLSKNSVKFSKNFSSFKSAKRLVKEYSRYVK